MWLKRGFLRLVPNPRASVYNLRLAPDPTRKMLGQKLVQFMTSRLKYTKFQLKQGTRAQEDLELHLYQDFRDALKDFKFQLEEGSGLLELFLECDFLGDEVKDKCAKLVTERTASLDDDGVSAAPSSATPRTAPEATSDEPAKQVCKYMHRYYSDEVVAHFRDKRITMDNKITLVALVASKMKLLHGNEVTYAHMVASMLVYTPEGQADQKLGKGPPGLRWVKLLKSQVAAIANAMPADGVHG